MADFVQLHFLLLDDSEPQLEALTTALEHWGHRVTACLDVEGAQKALNGAIDFAIVDLFLRGNEGDELSNGFVADELMPRKIPFIRMSSAPGLVPLEFAGLGIYDKRSFRSDPAKFKIYLDNRLPK